MSRWSFPRSRAWLRHQARVVHSPAWFPHVPLALAIATGGAWLLRWDLGAAWSKAIADLLTGHPQLTPRALPQLLVGVGMLIMALGLLLRSRVAWVMTLLLTVTAVVTLWLGSHRGGGLLEVYFVAVVLTLLLAGGSFDRSSIAASTLFALTSVVLLLLYATFGSYYLGAEFRPRIRDLVTALYYAVVTTTTVGYGDITPSSTRAQLFSVSIMVLGVAVFATSLTAVVAPMVSRSLEGIVDRKRRRMKRDNHFIVVGNTPLALNTWRELTNRGQPVTRVLRETGHVEADADDVVTGDPGSVDVLRQAGVERAQAVLAMLDDDSDNAFVVLAVRELGGSAKTVVAVNDARHLNRVRLAQPDLVIAPQILGGELAAMILCGEEVTTDFVMRCVLQKDPSPVPHAKRS